MSHFQTDADRWAAVCRRDPSGEGHFFFAVRTTGIYCRPNCPARRPRRENVTFYSRPDEAEQAGYRPCRRCVPNGLSPAEARAKSVIAACRLIERSDAAPGLEEIAFEVGFNPYHLHRIFKLVTGITPKRYAAWQRAALARTRLQNASSITDLIYDLGFGAPSRFYDVARSMLGMSPTAFREKGHGMAIRFAIADLAERSVLVAATQEGVCAIIEAHASGDAEQNLARLFSRATAIQYDSAFAAIVEEALGHIGMPAGSRHLPADISRSLFDERLWHFTSLVLNGVGPKQGSGEPAPATGAGFRAAA
jgi:AraC family transcriptional regulator of adaptative response/methylated-DNA-[protein]-cysteine methyltransferase